MTRLNIYSAFLLLILVFIFSCCGRENEDSFFSYSGIAGETGHCSLISTDGFLYLAGEKGTELYILKTDLNGHKIWERTYSSLGGSMQYAGRQIIETWDQCFVVSGGAANQICIFKIDAMGDSVWTYVFPENDLQFLEATIELSDHTILVVKKERISFDPEEYQLVLIRFSSEGDLLQTVTSPVAYSQGFNLLNWRHDENDNIEFTCINNERAFLLTISPGLEITGEVLIFDMPYFCNFSNDPDHFIIGKANDLNILSSKVLPPGSMPLEWEYPMPATEWVDLSWIEPIPEGYVIMGLLWYDDGKGNKVRHPFCLEINESGGQTWMWYDIDNFETWGVPTGFHFVDDKHYLLVGNFQYEQILIWRIK